MSSSGLPEFSQEFSTDAVLEHLHRRDCSSELHLLRDELEQIILQLPELAPQFARACYETLRKQWLQPGITTCHLVGGCVPCEEPQPIKPSTDVDLVLSIQHPEQSGLFAMQLATFTQNFMLQQYRMRFANKTNNLVRRALEDVRDNEGISASRLEFHSDGIPTDRMPEGQHLAITRHTPTGWFQRIRSPYLREIVGRKLEWLLGIY